MSIMVAIRVLHVVTELGMGGIQSFLMNVYRNINRNKIQFDFLLSIDKKGVFEDEIEKLGGKIYRVTPRKASFIRNKNELDQFFIERTEYKCIHCHFSNLSYLMPLKMAAKHKVPTRIIHSHSTHLPDGLLHKILHFINRRQLDNIATDFFACSDLAGEWLFGGTNGLKKQVIVNNGIPTSRYAFNETLRSEYREQLGVTKNLVIGNVGRLSKPKNHVFLLDIFSELLKLNPHVVLVLVGDGPYKEVIEQKIKALEIEKSVKMLGMRYDIPQILQAFDCFLMPSMWEGFPVALLEAESAGLPAYVSDTVTTQAKLNNNVKYFPLNYGAKQWARMIYNDSISWKRIFTTDAIVKAGYDIESTVKFLEEKYIRSYS